MGSDTATRTPIGHTDSTVAIITDENGGYFLQHRDDLEGLTFAGRWGLFGGALGPDEDPETGLRREIAEELSFEDPRPTYFTRLDFDLAPIGLRKQSRWVYTVPVTRARADAFVLREGQGMGWFTDAEVTAPDGLLQPHDAYILWLHVCRVRLYDSGATKASAAARENTR